MLHMRVAIVLFVGFVCGSTAWSAPTIVAGIHEGVPDSGLMAFYITAQGSSEDAFAGADLQFEILGTGAPMVVSFDLINDPGLLFFGNNTGQFSHGDPDSEVPTRMPAALTTTLAGTVGPNGNLALVVIDTTGVLPGVYPIVLEHPLFGPSDLPPFLPGETQLQNGVIRFGPEPGSIVLGLLGVVALVGVAARQRRAGRRRSPL